MKTSISAILLTVFLVINFRAKAQDTLRKDHLLEHVYRFNITDGSFSGTGSTFLIDELKKADLVLLGEYHGSARISEFTNALVPVLNNYGYKTLMAEVGQSTGQLLNSIQGNVTSNLKEINNKYLFNYDSSEIELPIPFFEHVEDAQFLQTLKNHNWQIVGIDQEFLYGFPMLIDKIYQNLNNRQRRATSELYKNLKDSLVQYYDLDLAGAKDISVSLKTSIVFNEFTRKTNVNRRNAVLIEDLNNSIEIYYLNATKRWFESNQLRVSYMKSMLKQQLKNNKIDLSKEKILFKMGAYHLSKGFSPLNFYEVGNMINGFADFHDKKPLHITFSSRFYLENGEIKDVLDSDESYVQRYKDLDKYGLKDEWVIIDLRPIIKGYFYYPRILNFNEHIIEIAKSYDLLIIPKTEMNPTLNYDH